MEWDTRAWLSDPAVTLCSPATRGIWKDLLDVMHECGRVGELCGTVAQLARLARCLPADLPQALTELRTLQAADITERNGVITIINRRMARDHKEREATRLRAQRFRERHKPPASVTAASLFPLKVQGSGLKEASAPLAAEPLRSRARPVNGSESSGFSGSGRCQQRFFEGWNPETEADYMLLMEEVCEEMETWGGKWRNRWREDSEKCLRCLADFRDESKQKIIAAPGGYMDDVWKNRMA